jgi:hypothetical protein
MQTNRRPRDAMLLAPLAMLGANSCTRTAGYLKTQGLRQAHLKHVKGTGQPVYAGSCFLIEASFSSENWGEKYCIRISVAFCLYLVKIIQILTN